MICELQEGTHNDIKESNHNRYKNQKQLENWK